ncbi:MAG: hypothetical protein KF781_02145 [Chitinophagaceae bacterium]|nr:hypothetical protein [Chitinophagaceae bacterium]MCW5904310.1 hypothetical protein [Chitinophagaceae bacterium]
MAIFAMGAGHGTYIPAMGLFPFGMLGVLLQDKISLPFIIIAILQYPMYGFIVDKANSSRQLRLSLLIVLLTHILLATLIIELTNENWR